MTTRYFLLIALLTGFVLSTYAQEETSEEPKGLYLISLADKEGTPYSVDEPEAFLSERSLERRRKHNTEVTEADLPTSPRYEKEILGMGIPIWQRSKWMNAFVVVATEAEVEKIAELPFVTATEYTAPFQYERESIVPVIPNLEGPEPSVEVEEVSSAVYGASWPNLLRMRGDSLHRQGYRGRGMLVAVFDGGFPKVDRRGFLGYPNAEEVPANYDLVEQDESALDGGSHGSTVLSTMAAYHPFFIVGYAPEARYVLFKTENGAGEHRQEEINYAIALEIADSIGVDVVNSSLGYTTFNDEEMNYTYEDMNGKVSPASIAADRAFERGLLVVTSAGNSGSPGDDWHYISAPADAEHIFSIGAMGKTDSRAYFSSYGPTSDGRVKPDVSGPGTNIPSVGISGGIRPANGTSLSSPLVCALTTCLWQAFPEATNQQIVDAIRQSASLAEAPNEEIGYGLPNFWAAYMLLARELRP
ncbi:MAG: S8 family serine peptidase [Bacteroidota bacterium]